MNFRALGLAFAAVTVLALAGPAVSSARPTGGASTTTAAHPSSSPNAERTGEATAATAVATIATYSRSRR